MRQWQLHQIIDPLRGNQILISGYCVYFVKNCFFLFFIDGNCRVMFSSPAKVVAAYRALSW